MGLLKEFKDFAVKGNALDMAVGIIIGAAFGTIVSSLVKDIINPPLGLLLGGVDFSNIYVLLKAGKDGLTHYDSLQKAQAAGAVTLNVGVFVNAIINFLIVSVSVFLVIRAMNVFRREQSAPVAAPTTKDCPECSMSIPITAKRCPHCTSQLV